LGANEYLRRAVEGDSSSERQSYFQGQSFSGDVCRVTFAREVAYVAGGLD
jgi:hypothetical protein